MPAALPVDNALDKSVKDFGIGTYDAQRDEDGQHGEDSEKGERTKKTLPDGGGSLDPFGPDRLLSYPTDNIVTSGILAYQDQVRINDPLYREWFRQKLADIVANPHKSVSWFPFAPSPTLLKIRAELKGYVAGRASQLVYSALLRELATAEVPGDHEGPSNHVYRNQETIDSRVRSTSQEEEEHAELPGGEPSARTDYYDHMTRGQVEKDGSPQKEQERTYDLWPDEDSGAWASSKTADTELPGVTKNEVCMDDFLSALGNAWSGFEVEDVSGVQGFPTTDLSENADFPRSDKDGGGRSLPPGGVASTAVTQKDWESKMDSAMKIQDEEEKKKVIESLYADLLKDAKSKGRKGTSMNNDTNRAFQQYLEGRISLGDALNAAGVGVPRMATNLEQVGTMTDAFIKEFGKKDLTKRHVLSFLQRHGQPQYLSSDIIRCLKLRHSVFVKDVLDEFPVAKKASGSPTLASIRERVIALEIESVRRPEVSSLLRRCAAALSRVIADMERLEGRHG